MGICLLNPTNIGWGCCAGGVRHVGCGAGRLLGLPAPWGWSGGGGVVVGVVGGGGVGVGSAAAGEGGLGEPGGACLNGFRDGGQVGVVSQEQ